MQSFLHRASKTLEIIRATAQEKIEALRQAVEYLRERLENFFGIYPVEEALIYTPQEEAVIHRVSEIVHCYFPQAPGDCLLLEDVESRCEALEDLGTELARAFEIENFEICITDSEEVFSENSGDPVNLYGKVDLESNCIYIRQTCLYLDDAATLEHVVSTLIHELRHLMQYQIMTLQMIYSVPYSRRTIWRQNCQNYIKYSEDPEGYFYQPLEADARNFTNRIWRNIYRKEIG